MTMSAPDKKGRRDVTLVQTQRQTDLLLDGDAFARLQPILDALQAAGVALSV